MTLLYMQTGAESGAQARREVNRAFEARFPPITVELDYNPGGEWIAKRQALISAGTPPDITWVGSGGDVVSLAARGALQDLGVLARRDKVDTSDTFDTALALFEFCGSQYAYPNALPIIPIFYNVEAFERAGVKLPPTDWTDDTWTFSRLLDAAKRLTADPDGGAGQSGQHVQAGGQGAVEAIRTGRQGAFYGGLQSIRHLWGFIVANGGELFDMDFRTCTIAEPAAVDALQFVQDLVFKHQVMPPSAELRPFGGYEGGALNAFVNGRLAMASLTTWIGEVRQGLKQRWDVAPPPRGSGPKARRAAAGGGWGAALTSPAVGARHLNEAWELVKFSHSRPQVETVIRYTGSPPALKSVAAGPVFNDPHQPPKSLKVLLEGAKYLRGDPKIVRWDDIQRVMFAELDRLASGAQDARSVAEAIKRGVDPILDEIHAAGTMLCPRARGPRHPGPG